MNKPTLAAYKAIQSCLESQSEKLCDTDRQELYAALSDDVSFVLDDLEMCLAGETGEE